MKSSLIGVIGVIGGMLARLGSKHKAHDYPVRRKDGFDAWTSRISAP